MVDEIAIVGRPLADAELDARRHRETRSTWRAIVVRSERRDREGGLDTNTIEGGGESVCGAVHACGSSFSSEWQQCCCEENV
jgi:hypothetical protein